MRLRRETLSHFVINTGSLTLHQTQRTRLFVWFLIRKRLLIPGTLLRIKEYMLYSPLTYKFPSFDLSYNLMVTSPRSHQKQWTLCAMDLCIACCMSVHLRGKRLSTLFSCKFHLTPILRINWQYPWKTHHPLLLLVYIVTQPRLTWLKLRINTSDSSNHSNG